MKANPRQIAFGIAMAIALAVSVGASALYAQWQRGAYLPEWVRWGNAELSADLDGDGAFEKLSLQERHVTVYDDGGPADEIPSGWFVSDAFVWDIDEGGVPEIILITWKRGSFGDSMPFWVERNDDEFSQHVFIMQYVDGKLRHHWMSSDVGMEIASTSMDDAGILHFIAPDGTETLGEWQGWGIKLLDEENPSWRRERYDRVSLLFAGDVIAHEGILRSAQKPSGNYDFSGIFQGIEQVVSAHDFAVANLEEPIAADASQVSGRFPLFSAPQELADAVADAGFDVVAHANNHMGDAGVDGIEATRLYWEQAHPDIAIAGLPDMQDSSLDPLILERNGIKVALVNYTMLLNDSAGLAEGEGWRAGLASDKSQLVNAVSSAQAQADITICFLHLGEEYADAPDDEVRSLAASLADAGADAIICSHPHVVQRTERMTTDVGNVAYVCYSIGNLLANQPYPQTLVGAMASLVVEKPRVHEPGGEFDDGADEGARIASIELIPTVCAFDGVEAKVLPLSECTREIAAAHVLNNLEAGSITLDYLQCTWRDN